MIIGAGLFLVWLLLFGGYGLPGSVTAVANPIISTDIIQNRANTTLPIPQGSLTIRQEFVPRWDGLREVELILARNGEPVETETAVFHLHLFDDNASIVERDLPTRTLTNGQVYTLRFPPQPHSAGRRYRLELSGSEDNPVSVRGYSLDVYEAGNVEVNAGVLATAVPPANAQDLYFITRTRLTWGDALISLGTMLKKNGLIMLLALFFLPLPGALLLSIENLRREGRKEHSVFWVSRFLRSNPLAWWGAALALGTAVWPLLWFMTTLLGLRWRGWALWLVFGAGWAIVVGGKWRAAGRRVSVSPSRPFTPSPLLPLLILILVTRLLAVRDLVFPPWVDSSRHGLITAVMTHSGQFPGSYEPFLPVENALYHFGFHAIAASLELMTNWPINQLLLFLGQLIQGLLPLTAYTAVILITRRRRAGLIAAFLIGLPFFFPGYYVTWGRFTQLTAMFIMPVLLAFTWLMVRGGRQWRYGWWLVSLLAAGLFLIHLRVFLFFIPFAAVVWVASLGRNGRWLTLSTASALLLISPRVITLLDAAKPGQIISNNANSYRFAFPVDYIKPGWERAFLWLAAAALLFAFIGGLRWRRWSHFPLILTGWVSVSFILLAEKRLGLPAISLVTLNSFYITVFLPLAMFLGVMGDRAGCWLQRWRPLQITGAVLAGGLLMAALMFGVQQQISILNEQTLLARQADLDGLAWLDERLPETAVFGVSSWKWLGETWAASDGGAWITPLTGRAATTPPIDHIYNRDLFQSVREFNAKATAVTDWSDPAQADWLRQQGVSHVFVGQRGGFFDPAALAYNPKMEMIYGRDGVFIFEIRE